MIKPSKLSSGATIGVIAPAGPIYKAQRIWDGAKVLEKLGFSVVISDNCFLKHGYLAGDDFIRAEDINKFFSNKNIDGIICLRGGYGCSRILNYIDYNNIRNNPKVFVGYSDITALHSAFHRYCNLVTFHGPMVASDLADNYTFNTDALIDSISGNISLRKFELIPVITGDTKGVIIGGNLSLIASLVGTSYQEDFRDKILFLEEIGEEPYSIDRMLHQLKHSGAFNNIRAVILGQFTQCEPEDKEKSLGLQYVIKDFFSRINLPVYSDLQAGHGDVKITLPLGVEVEVVNNILYYKEEGVK